MSIESKKETGRRATNRLLSLRAIREGRKGDKTSKKKGGVKRGLGCPSK